ncbi:hypothetical protein ACIGCZ_37095 [Streptomyces nigra]|uniref:hypothetical protein n=1 Tax=Streptomyces nigra TaxID=1827580 RepID=UPI0037D7A295
MNQPLDLDPIEARAKAATPGPWERYSQYGAHFYANTTGEYLIGVGDLNFGDGEQADADEAFVRHAREDVDALLAEVRRLSAQLEDQADADTVAARAAQVISSMGADLRAVTNERNRYRNAWHNARARAASAQSDVEFVEQQVAAAAVPAVPTTTKDGTQ